MKRQRIETGFPAERAIVILADDLLRYAIQQGVNTYMPEKEQKADALLDEIRKFVHELEIQEMRS